MKTPAEIKCSDSVGHLLLCMEEYLRQQGMWEKFCLWHLNGTVFAAAASGAERQRSSSAAREGGTPRCERSEPPA